MPVGACGAKGMSMRTDGGIEEPEGSEGSEEMAGSMVVPGAVPGSAAVDDELGVGSTGAFSTISGSLHAVSSSNPARPMAKGSCFIGVGRRYRRWYDV